MWWFAVYWNGWTSKRGSKWNAESTPSFYGVRSVVKTEGDVESGDDGVEIVLIFSSGTLRTMSASFPSIARVRQGIALSRVCTPLLSSGKLRAEAFKLGRVSAQHCVIGPGFQTLPQPTWITQRIMTSKVEQIAMTHSYV